MKRLLSVVLTLALTCCLVACGGNDNTVNGDPSADPPDGDTITLAVVAPMTGQDAEYGKGYQIATQIMADKWNEEGGLLGKEIVLKFFDDRGSPEEAASVAEQVVADDSITAVIGHFSSTCSMAAAPVYQEHGMLMIAPCASHEDFTGIGDWMWRVSPLSTDEARTVSEFVANYWGAEKIGQLVMNNDWGIGIAQNEFDYLSELNPDIEIVQEFVSEGNDDYGPVITNFLSADVDAVICDATYTLTAPFVKQLRQASPDIRVVAHVNCAATQVVEILGEDGDNYYCSANWSPCFTDDLTAFFMEEYAARSDGAIPIGDTAQVFDAISVLLQAIDNCGSTDREAIRDELAQIEYVGLTGTINFDENRECSRNYSMVYWDTDTGAWVLNTEWNA